jgi:spore germination cell wall hydrolase CwlJ-like protein
MKLTTKLSIGMNVAIIALASGILYKHVSEYHKAIDTANQIAKEVFQHMEQAKQQECMAKNIYHEARNEGVQGQRAVAWVTMNRVAHEDYPDTVCDVVYEAVIDDTGNPLRNQCQFSWYCDGKSDEVRNQAAWNVANNIAADVMDKFGKETDPTGGSIMYHADYVHPYWSSSYKREVQIDTHIFYVEG